MYYRVIEAKAAGTVKPADLRLSQVDINALTDAVANAGFHAANVALAANDDKRHYYYDSTHAAGAGAVRVIGGLSTGADNPCNIHPLARLPQYGGRRPYVGGREIFGIDDGNPPGYWGGLGLDVEVDHNSVPYHATIFIKDHAADANPHAPGAGTLVKDAIATLKASAPRWVMVPKVPPNNPMPGPCIQANDLWIAAPGANSPTTGHLEPQITLGADGLDPTTVAGAYQGYGGLNGLVEDPCDLGAALPLAYGGGSANLVWRLPAHTLPAAAVVIPAAGAGGHPTVEGYGVWKYAGNNNILYPILAKNRAIHDPKIQALGWAQVPVCNGFHCCPHAGPLP